MEDPARTTLPGSPWEFESAQPSAAPWPSARRLVAATRLAKVERVRGVGRLRRPISEDDAPATSLT